MFGPEVKTDTNMPQGLWDIYSHEQKKVYTRVFYVIQYLSNIFKNGFLHLKLDKIYNKVICFVSS